MVRDWKMLSFVANRAQVLDKADSEPPLGLTNVEEATSGAADAVDHIGGCAVANHFNAPSHSLGDMSILGLLQCHNDATRKLE
eukprot:g12601.t1